MIIEPLTILISGYSEFEISSLRYIESFCKETLTYIMRNPEVNI